VRHCIIIEYFGQFYTAIPEAGNLCSSMKKTVILLYRKPAFRTQMKAQDEGNPF